MGVLLILLFLQLWGQGLHPPGTFVTIPSGQHINHLFMGKWKVYFATEDGVMIYDHTQRVWRDPITISQGLKQYPVLLVWTDEISRDVWMVTPDHVFSYNETSSWMNRQDLPRDPEFSGSYALGITPREVVVRSTSDVTRYASFNRGSGQFIRWGRLEELGLYESDIDWIGHFQGVSDEDLFGTPLRNGTIKTGNLLDIDGLPGEGLAITAAGVTDAGEMFFGTYGRGIYRRPAAQTMAVSWSQGLLSPDVMTLEADEREVWIGNRTGITVLDTNQQVIYQREIDQIVYDLSYISALEIDSKTRYVGARGGVFQVDSKNIWTRLQSQSDLDASRIYALDRQRAELAIGTEEGVTIYELSGFKTDLFPRVDAVPTYDLQFVDEVLWSATVFGLYLWDSEKRSFTRLVDSNGESSRPVTSRLPDPFYTLEVDTNSIWAATHRGILKFRSDGLLLSSWLSPFTEFTPRALAVMNNLIWIATEQGIWILNTENAAWHQFTIADGLPSNFITDLALSGDYIWAGTNYGLARIAWKNIVIKW